MRSRLISSAVTVARMNAYGMIVRQEGVMICKTGNGNQGPGTRE